jgi:serine/threonine protein kinase
MDPAIRFDPPTATVVSAGRGKLAAADDPRIIRALEEYSAELKAGRKPDRRHFQDRYPDIADALGECLEGLEFVQEVAPQLSQPAAPLACADEVRAGAPLGDYRIIREIARGGMGVVYEAEQLSLARRVALKVLPFAAALDARQLQRFKNEAQAAAQLHHTNIVPVYGVGCERGVHYYAMQYIEGHSLAQLIAGLRSQTASRGMVTRSAGEDLASASGYKAADARRDTNGSATGSPLSAPESGSLQSAGRNPTVASLTTEHDIKSLTFFRTVANLGMQAAQALEHAHQVGVIHRDIKPANLLVDEGGNLWITDFGLAHSQNQAGLTMTGDLIGTLRYMSPEQALANRGAIDHRTDIYSLGVTLYEMLTLEPAFAGRDRQELLRQIAFDEPPAPRRRNQALPEELETIVLKSAAKSPDERYATALELAEDLRRYLRDEPIQAKRPTLLQRSRKWLRRHKGLVWSAAVAVLVCLVVTAGIMSLMAARLRDKNVELAKANRLEREQRRLANANAARTRQAVDDFFTKVSDSAALKAHGLEKLRRDLLQQARGFYEEFAREQSSDPAIQAERARAYYRLGRISAEMGINQDAIQSYREARTIVEQLGREYPAEQEYQGLLADTLQQLAIVYHITGQISDARTTYETLLTLYERSAPGAADPERHHEKLAGVLTNLALLYADTGQVEQAKAAYGRAQNIFAQLAAEHPEERRFRFARLKVLSNSGHLLRSIGELHASRTAYEEALAICRWLAREFPQIKEYRYGVGKTLSGLGYTQLLLGQPEPARTAYQESLAIFDQLAREHPDLPDYREMRGRNLNDMGMVLFDLRQTREAESRFKESLAVFERLAQEQPDVPDYPDIIAGLHDDLGALYRSTGQHAASLASYAKALPLREKLARDHPEVPGYREQLDAVRLGIAATKAARGECPSATATAAAVLGQSQQSGIQFYIAASVYSLASAAVRDDAVLRQAHAARAIELLHQAVAKRQPGMARLKTDPDFEPLKARPDFQQLLAQIQANSSK